MRSVGALLVLGCGLIAACSEVLSSGYEYGSVEVVARRRSGEPVPGVDLLLYVGTKHLAYGTTGADGRHLFSLVPRAPQRGGLGVWASPPEGYRPLDLRGGYYVDGIPMDEGDRRSLEFVYLKFGDGAVVVRVAEPSGEPIAGATLLLYSPQQVVSEGRTGTDGTYEFAPVPFGDYGVLVQAPPGYHLADGRRTAVTDGILVEEGVRERVSFVFERCRGDLTVRAADRSGQPVPGLPLTLYTSTGVVAEERTDEQGVHVFRAITCADYGVRLQPVRGYSFPEGRGSSYLDAIQVERDSQLAVSFELDRCEGRIQVRVLDTSGAPVPGAGLLLYIPGAELERVETGPEGTYEFTRVGCFPSYGIRVLPPEGFQVTSGPGSSYHDGIEVTSGSELQLGFTLTRS